MFILVIKQYDNIIWYNDFLFILGSETNVVHETPRRILILKTEGSKFAFSDYVFPGGTPQEALIVAGELLNLSEEKIELYDVLEKGIYFCTWNLFIKYQLFSN